MLCCLISSNCSFVFGAAVDGMMLHYMHVGEEYPLEEMKNYTIEKFCTPR